MNLDGGCYEQQYEQYLYDQDCRHTVQEVPVPCLMAKKVHSQDGTERTADQGEDEKRRFRNTPGSFAGLVLVHTHDDEAYAVDRNQIYDNKCNRIHDFVPLFIFALLFLWESVSETDVEAQV